MVFLTTRYRSQLLAERTHEQASRSAAYDLLSSDSQIKRTAGVHDLVTLADDHPGQLAQRAVDTLCEYLRAGHEGDELTEELIVRALTDHFRKDASPSWSGCSLNLKGAHFHHPVDFSRCIFREDTVWSGACFDQPTLFRGAEFHKSAMFCGTTFTTLTNMSGARFSGSAHFERALFQGRAEFTSTLFSDDAFFGAERSESGYVDYTFLDSAYYSGATFGRDAWFGPGPLPKGKQPPGGTYAAEQNSSYDLVAGFQGDATFSGAHFMGDAHFAYSFFSGNAWFSPRRHGHADGRTRQVEPTPVRFEGEADFDHAVFGGRNPSFRLAEFRNDPTFNQAVFEAPVSFEGSSDIFGPDLEESQGVELMRDQSGRPLVTWARDRRKDADRVPEEEGSQPHRSRQPRSGRSAR
ncbi:pentapeptide repeat-containing protein [Actinomyces wuliandei]|uniref:pentapeptide repeat-containing protein n=1 Tax=Actinomyces wuliandei TaxID=2057743 RepID=UPI00111B2779|nr:pentapeptide repeat-containing protein [Actinomyces wuliandei]